MMRQKPKPWQIWFWHILQWQLLNLLLNAAYLCSIILGKYKSREHLEIKKYRISDTFIQDYL